MADKKYYWLKLDRNFFKRHDIKIVESMPNGKDYVLFYMKLLLESIDHEGEISDDIEGIMSIASINDMNFAIQALNILIEYELIERSENFLFMKDGIRCNIIKSSESNGRDRNSVEYQQWRISVFERDDYTCRECSEKGGKLNAHHVKEWCNFEHSRFDVNNGITLCEKCHKAEHKRRYSNGRKKNVRQNNNRF